MFFKAVAPPLRHEAALTELLGSRRPDCIPPPLAVDRDARLDADGGRRADAPRADRGRARPESLARRASALRGRPDRPDRRRAPSCSRSACPTSGSRAAGEGRGDARRDRRISPTTSGAGSRRRCPGFARRATELAAAGIPETIQHDDLHDAQVFVRDGRYLLLDWGDACVSHPFFSLAVTLDGVIAWGVDDVRGIGADRAVPRRIPGAVPRAHDASDLVALSQTARRLGWLCRAVNSRRSQPSDESTRAAAPDVPRRRVARRERRRA